MGLSSISRSIFFVLGVSAFGLMACDNSTPDHGRPSGQDVAARTEADYLGVWETIGRSDSGLGTALEFLPEGKCRLGYLAVVDFNYRLEDEDIVLTLDSQPGETRAAIGEVADKTWKSDRDGKEVVRTRITEPVPASWIHGVWKYQHYTGATAYERYSSDGLMELRVVMVWQGKTWSFDSGAGKIDLHEVPEKGVISSAWLEVDQLHVNFTNDELMIFKRVTPWYSKKE